MYKLHQLLSLIQSVAGISESMSKLMGLKCHIHTVSTTCAMYFHYLMIQHTSVKDIPLSLISSFPVPAVNYLHMLQLAICIMTFTYMYIVSTTLQMYMHMVPHLKACTCTVQVKFFCWTSCFAKPSMYLHYGNIQLLSYMYLLSWNKLCEMARIIIFFFSLRKFLAIQYTIPLGITVTV